jgi:hypothetical protein
MYQIETSPRPLISPIFLSSSCCCRWRSITAPFSLSNSTAVSSSKRRQDGVNDRRLQTSTWFCIRSTPDDRWIVCALNGTIARLEPGGARAYMATNAHLTYVTPWPASFAIGFDGTIVRGDGDTWIAVDSPTENAGRFNPELLPAFAFCVGRSREQQNARAARHA